jgi:hypothetical protein
MRRNRSQFPIAALDANPRALHEDVAIGEKSQKLRSYGLALTGTVLLSVFGLVTCAPLALLGVWPLFALFNSDVRWAFTNSELPDETSLSTSTT